MHVSLERWVFPPTARFRTISAARAMSAVPLPEGTDHKKRSLGIPESLLDGHVQSGADPCPGESV